MDRRRPWWRRWLRRLAWSVVLLALASVVLVAVLRVVDPPTSAFMLARHLEAARAGESGFALRQHWVPLEAIAPALPIAAVASEDQRFPRHHGFDLAAIEDALAERERGGRVRGASTITQQVAKNLFLWSGRSWLRKGLEAWFTLWIELTWPKQRILEVYLNIAEFGDGIYGAEAASRAYFGKPAAALTAREAALLVAVLPDPRDRRPDRPSPYVRERAAWIERQVRQLGGPAYLESGTR